MIVTMGVSMTTENFEVNNVKCGGCVANIQNGLSTLVGVTSVDVDQASGKVLVEGESLDRRVLSEKLAELGYPER